MPPVLFFPLRLPQLKLPRLLTLPLGTGLHPARSLALLARLGAKHDPAHRVLSSSRSQSPIQNGGSNKTVSRTIRVPIETPPFREIPQGTDNQGGRLLTASPLLPDYLPGRVFILALPFYRICAPRQAPAKKRGAGH